MNPGITGSADVPSWGLAVAVAVKLLRVLRPARDAGVTSRRAHDGEALHSEGGHPRCSRLRTRISRIGKGEVTIIVSHLLDVVHKVPYVRHMQNLSTGMCCRFPGLATALRQNSGREEKKR